MRIHVLLSEPVGKVKRPAQANPGGDLAVEQLAHGADPDRGEHRVEVRVGDGGVATQVPAVSLAIQGRHIGARVHQRIAL